MATYDLTSSIPAASQLAAGDILNCPYSGSAKSVTLPQGTYKLEVWGAQGGYRSSTTYGGKGGYSYGTITLPEETIVYLYAGGHPGNGTSSAGTTAARAGGFNGGGYRTGYYGGGGGSDIRIGSNNLKARVIVAGGGGSDGATNKQGMYGGGITGGSSTENFTQYKNYCGKGGNTTYSGYSTSYTATSQVTAYSTTTAAYYGGFGFGGYGLYASNGYGGAGGGGWYGGAGTYPDGSADDDRGGGGGSGYVYTSSTASQYPSGCLLTEEYYLTDAATVAGNTSFKDYSGSTVTGHSGHGACRITAIEVIQPEDETGNKNLYIKTGANGSLPSGYVELDYIESSGTQCINTNFNPNNNTRIKLDFELFTLSQTSALFGGRDDTEVNVFGAWFTTSNTFCPHYGNVNYNTHPISFSDKTRRIYEINKDTAYCGKSIKKLTAGTFQSSYPLYILTMNSGGTIDTRMAKGRLYSCQIYDNGTLIRDYVPALQISTNKAGLYDIVNSTFYPDAAGGNFIYNRNSYIDNNTIYYINGNSATTNLGSFGTISNSGVIATPNGLLYFNGSSKLDLDPYNFGSSDFTVDWWEYVTDSSSESRFCNAYTTNTSQCGGLLFGYNGTLTYASTNTVGPSWDLINGTAMINNNLNEWVHWAFVRSGTTLTSYKNGVKYASTTLSGTLGYSSSLKMSVGDYRAGDPSPFIGYMNHFRISNCARWTSDFTPPNKNIEYGNQHSKITESYIKVPYKQTASFSSDYYPLKYIESSGTQWINTGFTPNQSSAISIDVQCFGKHSTHAALCSARPTSSTSTNTIMIFLSSGTVWNVDRGGTASNRTAFSTVSLTDRITVDLNKHHVSFNKGEVVKNFSATETFTCGGPLTLLYDYSHSQYPMKARLYGCKVWDDDTLVRDLVPALRISDNMAGLYDKVNSIFYPDAAVILYTILMILMIILYIILKEIVPL